jgi:predicted aldo/keto reductase-like oxidoreductase
LANPFIVMEPVKGGILAKLPAKAEVVLKQANPGASLPSWAIRFAASLEGVITVLSGMSNMEQMEDNLAYMDDFRPLNPAEQAAIRQVQEVLVAIPQVPCTDRKYCLDACPQNVAIPGTFKAYNDLLRYNNLQKAKDDYKWEIRTLAKASTCIGCGACEAVCPQSISIIERLAEAAKVLE